MVNAGVGGDTTAGGLRRLEWLLQRPIDVLVLELGGNDGLRGLPVSNLKANLQGMIDKAKAKNPEVKIVVAGMQMPPNRRVRNTRTNFARCSRKWRRRTTRP